MAATAESPRRAQAGTWPGQVPAWAVLGLSAVAAIAYGAWRFRPNAPIAWWFLGAGVLLFGTVLTVGELLERIAAVTADQVRSVAEQLLAGPRTLAVVGPFTASDFA